MTIDADRLAHLLSEVIMRIDPKDSTLPDTPEVRRKRVQLTNEVAALRARGIEPDVGMEFPDAAAQT